MKGGVDVVAHSSILRVVPSGPKIGRMDDECLAVAVVGGSSRARVPRQWVSWTVENVDNASDGSALPPSPRVKDGEGKCERDGSAQDIPGDRPRRMAHQIAAHEALESGEYTTAPECAALAWILNVNLEKFDHCLRTLYSDYRVAMLILHSAFCLLQTLGVVFE